MEIVGDVKQSVGIFNVDHAHFQSIIEGDRVGDESVDLLVHSFKLGFMVFKMTIYRSLYCIDFVV